MHVTDGPVPCKRHSRIVRCRLMKATFIRAILTVSMSLALGSTCRAADIAADFAKVRDGAASLGHSVANESRSFGHSVADTSKHAGHAIADTARRIGLDVKSGAQKVKSTVVHDGSKPKD